MFLAVTENWRYGILFYSNYFFKQHSFPRHLYTNFRWKCTLNIAKIIVILAFVICLCFTFKKHINCVNKHEANVKSYGMKLKIHIIIINIQWKTKLLIFRYLVLHWRGRESNLILLTTDTDMCIDTNNCLYIYI